MTSALDHGRDVLAVAGTARPPLTSRQLRVLEAAREAARLPPEVFVDGLLKMLPGVAGLADVDQAGFDIIMDSFVALGFRHPAVPLLSAAQLASLDACGRQLGLPVRDYLWVLRKISGAPSRRLLTGTHFLELLSFFQHNGAAAWVPEPGFMDRRRAGILRRTVWRAGLPEDVFRSLLAKFGGATHVRGLDERAAARVMCRLHQLGGTVPEAAPYLPQQPGMATQAQANLIWKLWHDAGGRHGDVSEAALDVAIAGMLGLPGGLGSLTRAGARAVFDRFMVPRGRQ